MYVSKTETASKTGGRNILRSVKDFKFDNATVNNKLTDHVIQRSLQSPLLVDGMRHEIRLYLLVASIDPLIVFLNEEGLVTFDPKSDVLEIETIQEKLQISENKYRRTLSSYWQSLELHVADPIQVRYLH